jgi:hypothetical protein
MVFISGLWLYLQQVLYYYICYCCILEFLFFLEAMIGNATTAPISTVLPTEADEVLSTVSTVSEATTGPVTEADDVLSTVSTVSETEKGKLI